MEAPCIAQHSAYEKEIWRRAEEYSKEMAYAMINAGRQTSLDAVDSLQHIRADVITKAEIQELKRLVNEKYDQRLRLYDEGKKQWDANVSVTMIMRGIK